MKLEGFDLCNSSVCRGPTERRAEGLEWFNAMRPMSLCELLRGCVKTPFQDREPHWRKLLGVEQRLRKMEMREEGGKKA